MIVCIGHHCIGIACYSRWCCDVHRLQSHDHIFTCICMSATCSLGLGSLSIEHPTVHSVWAAWQLLKFVPQHIGFVLNCGMAHVVPPLMLVACLQLAFITCSLDRQPFSGGLCFFWKPTDITVSNRFFHLSPFWGHPRLGWVFLPVWIREPHCRAGSCPCTHRRHDKHYSFSAFVPGHLSFVILIL